MATSEEQNIQGAEIVLPCTDLDETLAFFTDRLSFRVAQIFPADDPAVVVLAGHSVRVRLERGRTGDPGSLRLLCHDPASVAGGKTQLTAPNGTRIELVAADPPLVLPEGEQTLVIRRMSESDAWGSGRAGMQYRDLEPGRQGGRFIASHIRIPDGGPVGDYPHFHKIRFQMIYCYKGWVRVVYEDQGPPFVMPAGDCVLQPPEIRHQVLECSPGMEVVEIGCPAEHMTLADLDMTLPTSKVDTGRLYGGQRFVRHQVEEAEWKPWRLQGFEARDIGFNAATNGLAGARVVRVSGTPNGETWSHDGEFLFLFVLDGNATLDCEGRESEILAAGDCCTLPAGRVCRLDACSADLELLEVALPALI